MLSPCHGVTITSCQLARNTWRQSLLPPGQRPHSLYKLVCMYMPRMCQLTDCHADDEDIDEEAIPAFSRPTLPSDDLSSSSQNKGKSRAQDQLAPPGAGSGGGGSSSSQLSGNIGSGSGATKGTRRTVGGVRVETRYVYGFRFLPIGFIRQPSYSGADTLDEPVTATIASVLQCSIFVSC